MTNSCCLRLKQARFKAGLDGKSAAMKWLRVIHEVATSHPRLSSSAPNWARVRGEGELSHPHHRGKVLRGNPHSKIHPHSEAIRLKCGFGDNKREKEKGSSLLMGLLETEDILKQRMVMEKDEDGRGAGRLPSPKRKIPYHPSEDDRQQPPC